MAITYFPPVSEADEEGIVMTGGDLELESLLLAYKSGIFPFPHDGKTLAWFSPSERAVLFFADLHISKSLKRELKREYFRVTHNSCFEEVLNRCAVRIDDDLVWITREMKDAYLRLFEAGHAHSMECFVGNELVGGIFGTQIGQYFSAESMFYSKPYASKICLVHLVHHLREQGLTWVDCQMPSPHIMHFGAKLIPRVEFINMVKEAVV